MDQLVLFIQTNWQGIATIVIALATLLITILKKKVKIIDTIKEFILTKLPGLISSAEILFKKDIVSFGVEKKSFVIEAMKKLILDEFGCTADKYVSFISDSIESILATPQKKGD